MKISLSKRIVSFVLCLTVLLAGFAYKPQKAEAVAVTASVVASVAAIMTAAGVTYWASTQQDAIDYLGGKIDAYLASLETVPVSYEEWLGINGPSELFSVTAEGAMRFGAGVANKISAFVSSLFADEGIQSGGNAVDIGGGGREFYASEYSMPDFPYTHNFMSRAINATDIHVMFSASRPNDGYSPQWQILVPVEHSAVTVTVVSGSNTAGSWGANAVNSETGMKSTNKAFVTGAEVTITDDSKDYILLCFRAQPTKSNADNQIFGGGEGTIRITSAEDIYTPPSNTITPGEAVAVQGELAENDYLDVAPSVPLSSGMSVETAADAVLGGVASEDGLTSEGQAVEGSTVNWGWLSDILDTIRDFLASIAQTVIGIPQAISQAASDVIYGVGNAISTALYNAFVPSEAAIDAFVATLSGNFDNHFSILSYPFSLLGRFVLEVVDAPGGHELVWPDIYEPFSGQRLIAAGSYNLDNALANENFRTAYDIYMTVIKGYIAFQFIAYLYAWFCDVFRMRNDDYANPIFEQEPIDDGPDDWDGYDSYFET